MYITTGLSEVQTAPRLLEHEVQPRAVTFYAEIDLKIGKAVKPLTGIFCPENYRPAPKVDLIVYLHGYNNNKQCFRSSGVIPINEYWKSRTFWLREEVNKSGKNIILVAPTLGQKSEAGNLAKSFKAYLDQVMAVLIAYGPYRNANTPPQVGNIIVAGHSGGGSPMLRIAMNRRDPYAANIREYWGFDCLYSGYKDEERKIKSFAQPDLWLMWAKLNKTKQLFIHFMNYTRLESCYLYDHAKAMKLTDVVHVQKSEANHCSVPISHFNERLQGVPFLLNR